MPLTMPLTMPQAMPLTLANAGPAGEAAADGSSSPAPPEVFAALLTSSAPAPPATSSGPASPTAKDEVVEIAVEEGALPVPTPLDAAASWLLPLGLPRPPLTVVPRAPERTTSLPGAGAATALTTATECPATAPLELPQKPGAPVEPPHGQRAPSEASTTTLPQAPPIDPATPPVASLGTRPTDPSVLGPGLVQVTTAGTAPAPDVDRTETLAAVRPALVAAAETLRVEGGRTSLVIRLDPPSSVRSSSA